MADKWYSDASLIRSFGAVLATAGVIEGTDDFTAFLDQPQRYDEYFDAWSTAGYPTDSDNNWDEFVELVSNDDESDEDDEEDGESDDSE